MEKEKNGLLYHLMSGMNRAADRFRRKEIEHMFLIVGLGNPGRQYENTRHNTGFLAIDALAEKYGIPVDTKKHKALIGKGVIDGHKVVLAKPQTFMNISGESIRAMLDYYKLDEESELLVIYDDVSLGVGELRIRKKGSAGGHNGIKSILSHLGHNVFGRIKVGVGEKPKGWDLADYVLGNFSKAERGLIDDSLPKICHAVEIILNDGMDEAMNRIHEL